MKTSLLPTTTSLLLCVAAVTLSPGAFAQTNGAASKPVSVETAEIRTPKAPATPRINGPAILECDRAIRFFITFRRRAIGP